MPAEVVERVSLLALAWDRKVLVAKLVKSELKVYGKWSLESAAIGVAWLDDQVCTCLFVFCHAEFMFILLTKEIYVFLPMKSSVHGSSLHYLRMSLI